MLQGEILVHRLLSPTVGGAAYQMANQFILLYDIFTSSFRRNSSHSHFSKSQWCTHSLHTRPCYLWCPCYLGIGTLPRPAVYLRNTETHKQAQYYLELW